MLFGCLGNPNAPMSEPANILYVDDEELSHILFKAVFGDDFAVHRALSAREALDILRREPIHLLVTDQCMPEMTGAELLVEIRDEFPDIGRVMLTAYSDLDAIVQAVNAGRLDRYVTKPWDAGELREVIDQTLERYDRRIRRQQEIEELRREVAREKRLRRAFQEYVPESVLEELLGADHGD